MLFERCHAQIERDLSNCTYNTSISGVKFSWTPLYSVDSLESIKVAEETLRYLWDTGSCMNKAVILVGNKTDLVRTRVVDITSEQLINSRL